jgi:hypothetical protein
MGQELESEEIKRIITLIHNSFEQLKTLKNQAKNELSTLDKELSNHYHKIEGSNIVDTFDSHLLIMGLRDILWNRREAKIKHTLLESFVSALDTNMNKSKKRFTEIINKHEEIKKEIIKRAK